MEEPRLLPFCTTGSVTKSSDHALRTTEHVLRASRQVLIIFVWNPVIVICDFVPDAKSTREERLNLQTKT